MSNGLLQTVTFLSYCRALFWYILILRHLRSFPIDSWYHTTTPVRRLTGHQSATKGSRPFQPFWRHTKSTYFVFQGLPIIIWHFSFSCWQFAPFDPLTKLPMIVHWYCAIDQDNNHLHSYTCEVEWWIRSNCKLPALLLVQFLHWLMWHERSTLIKISN